MKISKRMLGAVSALLLVGAGVAEAHAIHTTLTVVSADATGITLNIRAFADDFSGSVAKYAGHLPPKDSSAAAADVARYVRAHFLVATPAGAAAMLEPCGIRRAGELYLLCFRAAVPQGGAGATLRNQMLTEWHSDQVNIVQVERNGSRKTLLFTKGSAATAIGAG
jgi:hypothetical protein